MRKTINSPIFRALYRAQDGKCFYCGKRMLSADGKGDDLTIDHFIPLSKGGNDHHHNYVLACRLCNESKADRLPNAKQRTKKFYMSYYIKYNKPDIFKMTFREKKSYFEVKRLAFGNTVELNKMQAA